jgi:ferrochelatase
MVVMGKRGVLLMNIGTPDEATVGSVRKYLREFLLDPDVIDIPAVLRHLLVRGVILRVRPRNIAPRYASIWMDGDSPLRIYTNRMAEKLQLELSGVECEVGMRYGNPSIESALRSLKSKGVEELLLAPLFPQHAQATTESSMKEAFRQLRNIGWSPDLFELGHFEEEPEFIMPLASSIRPHLNERSHLLFSFHGLPISHVKRTDKTGSHCQKVDGCCAQRTEANSMCYAHHCSMTAKSVVEELGLPDDAWSISYQSRLGPAKWLKPSTLSVVEDLAKKDLDVVVVSPAFLADGLETLEELDIEVREHYISHGGNQFSVIKCLNDNPDWILGLSKLVEKRFSSVPN